jgi:hypothetical protein
MDSKWCATAASTVVEGLDFFLEFFQFVLACHNVQPFLNIIKWYK